MLSAIAEREYRDVVDKSSWGDGPWRVEPDKVQWTDAETGLPCLAVRGPLGQWCGYVAVADGHPAFEQDYGEVDVRVHGGLTYSDHCQAGPENRAVCHIPEPGQPDHVWWLGFDCAHSADYVPAMDRGPVVDVFRVLADALVPPPELRDTVSHARVRAQ